MKWRLVNRKMIGAVASIASLSLVAVACSSGTNTTLSTRSGSAPAPTFVHPQENGWGDTWSVNPYNPNWNGELDDVSLLPLAIAKPPKLGAYIPELATSWKVTSSKVTIKLRPDARWQNGKPLTSKDVLDSLELYGANGNNLWAETTGMTTPNAHTLVMDVRSGQSAGLLLYNVLGQLPVPASQYGKFVTRGLQHDLISYYARSTTSAPSTTSPAGKAIGAVDSRLTKYVPKTFIGDGPYRDLGITTSEMKLQLWKGIWDAKRIHVTNMVVENITTNDGVYPLYYSHQADWSNTGMLQDILDKWLHTSDHGYTTMSAYTQYGLDFNNKRYPLNQTAFRQAIAYIVDRPEASLAAYGGLHLIKPDRYEDGVDYSLESTWLTPAELKQLNTYPHDPAKATSLLQSLHFTKKNGRWYEPNGTPVTLNLTFEGGDNDAQGMASSVGSQLTNFGLKTEVIGAADPTYYSEIPAGTFEIGWEFVGGGGLDPLADQASEIGTSNNYPPVSSGSAKAEAGLGFGPTMNVPGLGKVDVSDTVTREASTVGPSTRMKQLVWDWAQTINKNLPYLVIGDKVQQVEYSTYHYVDWPPASTGDWRLMGLNLVGGLVVALQQGYIRPRS